MKELYYTVSDESEGERLDKYLSLIVSDISRSYIQKIIKDGLVLVNDKNAKSSLKLDAGDKILLNLPDLSIPEILPENIPIDIIYEDKNYMIINKNKGMVVHPAPGHYTGTLVNAIIYHTNDLSGINGVLRPGIVHRIDRDTTGLLIVCKNDKAHNNIALQLKEHNIERTYHAIVTGNIKEDKGVINKNIARDQKDRKKMSVTNNLVGKTAITHFEVIERFGNYTYVKCNLETGRTHQIRVHMASIGHPLLGDEVYGHISKNFVTNGQVLHAKTIGFNDPDTNEFVLYDSELPEYFLNILKKLRNKNIQ